MDIQKLVKLFEELLAQKKYSNSFGFACFFGSLNLKHDLDFFIVQNKKERKGRFLKLLILFLEDLKAVLKKENYSLLIVPYSVYEDELKYIAKKSKKQLVIHVCSFPDVQPCKIKILIDYLHNPKNRITLKESFQDVEKMKATKYDYWYNYLHLTNVLLANYPKKLEKQKIFDKVSTVYKLVSGKKKNLKGTPKKVFFECLDFLDKRAY